MAGDGVVLLYVFMWDYGPCVRSNFYVFSELRDYVLYYDVGGCPQTYVEPYVVMDVLWVFCSLIVILIIITISYDPEKLS